MKTYKLIVNSEWGYRTEEFTRKKQLEQTFLGCIMSAQENGYHTDLTAYNKDGSIMMTWKELGEIR